MPRDIASCSMFIYCSTLNERLFQFSLNPCILSDILLLFLRSYCSTLNQRLFQFSLKSCILSDSLLLFLRSYCSTLNQRLFQFSLNPCILSDITPFPAELLISEQYARNLYLELNKFSFSTLKRWRYVVAKLYQ